MIASRFFASKRPLTPPFATAATRLHRIRRTFREGLLPCGAAHLREHRVPVEHEGEALLLSGWRGQRGGALLPGQGGPPRRARSRDARRRGVSPPLADALRPP